MDERLCELITDVLGHPDGSPEQRRSLDKLIDLVPRLRGISKRQKHVRVEYREVLNQALAAISVDGGNVSGRPLRLFVEKFKLDLDTADPAFVRECFVKRFNRILKNINAQMCRQMNDYLSLDAPTRSTGGSTALGDMVFDRGPDPMERAERAETRDIGRNARRYIEEDPEGKLRDCYPSGYPQSNCQELAKRRLLKEPPDKWKEIALVLNVPFGTVTAHWKRKCSPLLQIVVKNLGYQPQEKL